MYKGFFPTADGGLLGWAPNLKTKAALHATALGLTVAEVTAIDDDCDAIVDAILNDQNSRNAAAMASANKRAVIADAGSRLRNTIARLKTAPGYTDAIGEDLACVGSTVPFDPNTYQPKLRAQVIMEAVLLSWIRGEAEQVKLFGRLKGQAEWQLLAMSTQTTYLDNRPLAQPGVPEIREYMACGVVKDQEIGQCSDIVTVVYAANP